MQLFHVYRHRPFGSLLFLEADTIAFIEALETQSLDTLVMDEQIFSTLRFDETIPLVVIEPFYSCLP